MLLSCEAAASAVKAGEIIAYPTEAIYGLGCDPTNQSALRKLVDLKSRSANKGLILVAANWEQLDPFVSLTDQSALETAMQSWPGPVTWIMPSSKKCSSFVLNIQYMRQIKRQATSHKWQK